MGKNYAEVIRRCGLVPVIALDDPDGAVPLARALLAGGITVAEITFRTAAAQEAIRRMREVPGITVGAGTVLTHEQADRAIEAGAEFLVTPGFNPDMVRYAQERGVFIVPGTSVPGEMEQALALGLETVKFFPAEQSGGAAKLKAVAAVYPRLRFMPTGGITAENMSTYLKLPNVIACGGSWMVKGDLLRAGDFEAVTRLSRQAVRRMLDWRVASVCLPAGSGEALDRGAALLEAVGLERMPGDSEPRFEQGLWLAQGGAGCLRLETAFLERAEDFLLRRGVAFDPGPEPGEITLREPLLGFTVRVAQA